MRENLHRFFYDGPLISEIEINDEELHHIKVLRVEKNEKIELINGKGALVTGTITELSNKKALISVEKITQEIEPSNSIFLGVPLMRMSKLEWIIEKCSEIGIKGFCFYVADQSEKQDLSNSQVTRLKNLLIASAKQSKRIFFPELECFSNLDTLLSSSKGQVYFGDLSINSKSHFNVPKSSIFISGPEKGFSSKEQKVLEKVALGIKLSEFTLRSETAPIVAASIFCHSVLKTFST
jgi:16S rRNA (uracil1498-N3)-methyltransferase